MGRCITHRHSSDLRDEVEQGSARSDPDASKRCSSDQTLGMSSAAASVVSLSEKAIAGKFRTLRICR